MLTAQIRKYTIEIRDRQFRPDYLVVEKNSIIEWKLCSDSNTAEHSEIY